MKSYTSLQEFLDAEIYPNVNIEQLLPKLHLKTDSLGSRLNCPKCGKATFYISKGTNKIICSREFIGCVYKRTLVEILTFPKKPIGDVYRNVINLLVKNAGKEIPTELYGQPGTPRKQKDKVRIAKVVKKLESFDKFISRGGKVKKY